MKTNIKQDIPFLSKFIKDDIYIKNYDKLAESIIVEIHNILSSRLKISDKLFFYGIKDIESSGFSVEDLKDFKIHCEKQILKLEPRLESIEIININTNKEKQILELEITCYIKNIDKKFNTNIRCFI